jgi:acyl carrier protein
MKQHTITFSDYKKMKGIVSSVGDGIPPSKIVPKAHIIYDLGLDSLDRYELSYALEQEFGISIPDDAIWQPEASETVRNAMLLVGQHLKEARSARQ